MQVGMQRRITVRQVALRLKLMEKQVEILRILKLRGIG